MFDSLGIGTSIASTGFMLDLFGFFASCFLQLA
jgi:hypothetical protein